MQITDIRILVPTLLVLGLGVLVYLLSPILAPFVVGALMAYLGDPLIDRLETYKLSRGLAVSCVFLILVVLITLMLLLLLPMLGEQINGLVQRLPVLINRVSQWLSTYAAEYGVTVESIDYSQLAKDYLPQAGDATKGLLKAISQSSGALINWVVIIMLTPIITFYLLRDWDLLVAKIYDLIPHDVRATVSRLVTESDSMLSAFLRGQLLVMTALGTIYAIGLTIIGLPFALLIGFVAGLLSFIPYLGTLIGVFLAIVLYIAEFQEWVGLWQVGVVFLIGQSLEGYFLTPWLVGDKIGLHPVAVIFAVLAGGQLFGFVGVLLALPVSSVLVVLLRESVSRYKNSSLYLKGLAQQEGHEAESDADQDMGQSNKALEDLDSEV